MTTTTRNASVRRNALNQISRIVESGENVTRYSLDNGFDGEPVATRQLAGIVQRHFVNGRRTRLTHDTGGQFTLRVHSNLWYDFRSIEIAATGRTTRPPLTDQEKAAALHERLAEIDVAEILVVTADRIGRKERAKAARELFGRLELKGISVRAPRYAMAQSVDVTLPRRRDYEYDADSMVERECEANVANRDASSKIAAILDRAFPGCLDRSDSQTDYFDYCWSID